MYIDNGINLIDTANICLYGEAEKIVGEILKEKRSGDVQGQNAHRRRN
ncbi:MAG: aldo/keto reductase [Bacteroidota bacterium]